MVLLWLSGLVRFHTSTTCVQECIPRSNDRVPCLIKGFKKRKKFASGIVCSCTVFTVHDCLKQFDFILAKVCKVPD